MLNKSNPLSYRTSISKNFQKIIAAFWPRSQRLCFLQLGWRCNLDNFFFINLNIFYSFFSMIVCIGNLRNYVKGICLFNIGCYLLYTILSRLSFEQLQRGKNRSSKTFILQIRATLGKLSLLDKYQARKNFVTSTKSILRKRAQKLKKYFYMSRLPLTTLLLKQKLVKFQGWLSPFLKLEMTIYVCFTFLDKY